MKKIRAGRYSHQDFLIIRTRPDARWEIIDATDGRLVSASYRTLAEAVSKIDHNGQRMLVQARARNHPSPIQPDVGPRPWLLDAPPAG